MSTKKAQDLAGEVFGKLKVLRLEKIERGNYFWLCRCDCGNTTITRTGNLNNGMTKSCGCIHKDQLKERNKSHGLAKTPIYNVWSSMKARCNNSNDASYKNYGGRGIAICDKWRTFEGFYEDMGNSYKKGLTIERINVNGNYCLDNCCWADTITQGNNTRRNRFLTIDGITDTMSNLCRRYGLPVTTVKRRLERGWDVEKTFKTPKKF